MPNRRTALKNLSLAATGMALQPLGCGSLKSNPEEDNMGKLKGNIHHSVCQWTYGDLSLDQLCQTVKKIGFAAIDLVGPKDWPTLKKWGVDSSMCNGAELGLTKGWNNPAYHAQLIKNYREHIDLVADAGYKNLIFFTGNRDGMDDETGLKNCVTGLRQVLAQAEKRGVTLQLEIFNTKVDHAGYMANSTAWAVELGKRLGSPAYKILYDIYHMQVEEGNVIQTFTAAKDYIGHYHTAGVPGRHEIGDAQELNYPAIMRAIVATGFKGYVAQEFIPTAKDKLASLRQAVRICDV